MFSLLNVAYVFFNHHLPQHVEASKDAFIGEVKLAVAGVAVLFDGLLLQALLGDVSLLITVVAEVVASSASK